MEPDPYQTPTASTPDAGSDSSTLAIGDTLQDTVAESSDALLVVDDEGIVRFVNPAAKDLFGRPIVDLLGQPFGFLMLAGKATDIEIIRPDGGVTIAELRARDVAWRGARAHLASLCDVTSRKRAEQMLIESQQVLRAALDSLATAVLILDREGAIIAANKAWVDFRQRTHDPEHRLGLGDNYLAAYAQASAYHPEAAELTANIRMVLDGAQPSYSAEYPVKTRFSQRWFTLRATACGDGWARAVLTFEDITHHKQREILDADKRQVLELVARQHSLDTVISRLLTMVHNRYPDLAYGAILLRGAGVFRSLGVGVADHYVAHLDQWATLWAADSGRPDRPGLLVVHSDDPLCEDRHTLTAEAGISRCWRAPFQGSLYEAMGQLILCRRSAAEPLADDTAFVELVGQLLTIAVEQHERTRQLAHQAHHDALTGLPNRLLFEDRLRQALEGARRTGRMVAILFIDLDRFKQINDTLGHAVGDALLAQLARRFEGCVRATDTLARHGGDEFMLVLPGIEGPQQVTRVAHRLHAMLHMPFLIDGNELFVSASIGASLYPTDGEDADTLQRNADAAMYRAKNTLRNSFQFFDATVTRTALERLQLETHLRRAIERDELAVYYQPKVDQHRRLAGAEALLRWHHPELGQIPPARFIPLAEELGLIVSIGEWCLSEICRQVRLWQRHGLPPLKVAANVSALQFAQPSFIPTVTQILAQSELDPRWLELELTESMLMGDVEAVLHQLRELRALNLTLAIDDFGTGFSSLVYLQRLPISVLKVDRSFVGRIGTPGDESERGIVSAIVTLGRHLHMDLVAEGVETPAQHAFLQTIGCNLFQGYLFSEPLPPILFEHLMRGGTIPGPLWRA
ncbi:MAG: EAL domain-containing protein [Chloroflexales bacterium]|nr:EAL domain-containing protein [Chloroflexales bacterium]